MPFLTCITETVKQYLQILLAKNVVDHVMIEIVANKAIVCGQAILHVVGNHSRLTSKAFVHTITEDVLNRFRYESLFANNKCIKNVSF